MKRAFVVHCWSGHPNYCWYPYVKSELEKKDFSVEVPAMPDTDAPNLNKWLPKLKEVVGKPDKDTYLIGHSAGCITILRYLESLSEEEAVGGVVLVAGFLDDLGFEEIKNFFVAPIDFQKIKSRGGKFVAIVSDDDPYVPLDRGVALERELGARLIIKHNMKHFSGPIDGENSCIELPDVVNGVLEFGKNS